MFKRVIFIHFFIISYIYGESLQEIIKISMENNKYLQSLSKEVDIKNSEISLSQIWENPTIGFGANDIWFSNPSNRSLEAMQTQYITLSQVLPTNNKLDFKKKISIYSKDIAKLKFKNEKLKVISLLSVYIYKIVILQKKIDLIKEHQKNMINKKDYALILYKSGKTGQTDALNAEIMNSMLEIKKENLNFKKKQLYLKIEKLLYQQIGSVEESIEIFNIVKPNITEILNTHPAILIADTKVKKTKETIYLENAKKFGDIKLTLGYNQRVDREDYLSFSLSLPLPVYGNENIKVNRSRFTLEQNQESVEVIKNNFKTEIEQLYLLAEKSKKNYQIISSKIRPLKNHIQNILETNNSRTNRSKSTALVENINDIITLDLLALDELDKFFESYGKLKYYTEGNNL